MENSDDYQPELLLQKSRFLTFRALGALLLLVGVLCTSVNNAEAVSPYLYKLQWGGIDTPTGIAYNSDSKKLFVVDQVNEGVNVYDTDGTLLEKHGLSYKPYGIAVNSQNGDIYITDATNHAVRQYDSLFRVINEWGGYGSANGQFAHPRGIAVGNVGYVYVVDNRNHRIQVFNTSGVFQFAWGSYGSANGAFSEPVGIAANSTTDFVIVTDTGNNRVQKFDRYGLFLTKWGIPGSLPGEFSSPWGTAIDSSNNVFVADAGNNDRIQKFTSDGTFAGMWGSHGTGNGQFDGTINGLAMTTATNKVFVADTGNNRVQRFDPDLAGPVADIIQFLPKTGQKICYDAAGAVIACAASGQDGAIQAGMEWPAPRFTNNADGTLTDKLTGLMWVQNGNLIPSRDPGFDIDGTVDDGKVIWARALYYIYKLNAENYLGHNDWRLPNINELKSLLNHDLVSTGFTDQGVWLNSTQGFSDIRSDTAYWSSTPDVQDPATAVWVWKVGFNWSGTASWRNVNVSQNNYVLPMRTSSIPPVINLPRTGQTLCYEPLSAHVNPMNCEGPFYVQQDGGAKAGINWPPFRFTTNVDSTITDNLSHLIWTGNAQTPGPAGCAPGISKNWQEGLDYITCLNTVVNPDSSVGYLGHTDWRMPNINELQSLFHFGQADNRTDLWLNSQGFSYVTNTPYWSSTTDLPASPGIFKFALTAHFAGGVGGALTGNSFNVSDKTQIYSSYSVWPVRGGNTASSKGNGITINNGDSFANMWSTFVQLGLSASDPNGVTEMKLSNDAVNWLPVAPVVQQYQTRYYDWPLTAGDGLKTVYAKFMDGLGNWSGVYSDTITLDTTPPLSSAVPSGGSFDGPVTVTLGANEPGAIFYSTDGNYPSHFYSQPIPISVNSGATLRFVAYDIAGNAESPANSVQFTITPRTTVSPPGGWYNSTRAVNLVCQVNDYACYQTRYALTGVGSACPAAGVAYTTYTGAVSVADNKRFCFYSIDINGNSETVKSEDYQFEITVPSVTLSTPSNGAALDTLYQVTGTTADSGGSGVNRVEVQITDGTWYVQSNQSMSTSPAWLTATLEGGTWILNTSLVNWANSITYTINARAYDNAGNVSTIASRNFKKVPFAYTFMEFYPDNSSIQNGGSITLTGKLSRLPAEPNYDMSGKPLRIRITAPSGSFVDNSTYTTTLFDGSFFAGPLTGFTEKGLYTISVNFDGISGALGSATESKNINVGTIAGYAVLVEGRIWNDTDNVGGHNPSHAKTAQRIYDTLKLRGFTDDNIYYLAYGSPSGSDGVPDKTTIETVLTAPGLTASTYSLPAYPALNGQPTLARKMNTAGQEGPLYIIFVDHGDADKLYIDNSSSTAVITSSTAVGQGNGIKEWLASLETSVPANTDKRFVILGACYSGSFINDIQGAGRVVITSAAAGEQSFKGAMESDNIRSGELFLEELFASLRQGSSFKDSFVTATDKVRTYTRIGGSATPVAPYFDTALQHPLLDDDGLGGGSNNLSESGADGAAVKDLYLGFPVTGVSSYLTDADILSASATSVILTNAQISSTVRIDTRVPQNTLWSWVEVRSPLTTLFSNGQNRQLDPGSFGIAKSALAKRDNGTPANLTDDYFDGSYAAFVDPGKYEVNLYAQETTVNPSKGRIAPFKRITVYKQQATTSPPTAFIQIGPENSLTPPWTTKGIAFSWTGSAPTKAAYAGQAANRVTYTLELSKDDSNFNLPLAYKLEEISSTSVFIGPEAHLEDLRTYYWRITAIDNYGNSIIAGNAPFVFKTDNTNLTQLGGMLIQAFDLDTNAMVTGVRAMNTTDSGTTSGHSCNTSGGTCTMVLDAGVNLTLVASEPSYLTVTKNAYIDLKAVSPPPPTTTFQLSRKPAKIGTSYFDTMLNGYAVATGAQVLQIRSQTFTGPFNFNRTVAVTLEGGYDSTYSATRSGYTELTGSVTISSGQVTMDRVVVR